MNSRVPMRKKQYLVGCQSERISLWSHLSRPWALPHCYLLEDTAQTTLLKRSRAARVTWSLLGDISCKSNNQFFESRLITSANPDLVERLRSGEPLYRWDRSRFYGPFPDNEVGYTVHHSRDISGRDDHLKGQLA